VWLVLAHAGDRTARELTERWPAATRLVTPAEVCAEGWVLELDGSPEGPPSAVDGVLTRLGGIGPEDLGGVHAADRDYAAAELGAFLLAWLDACSVPVLNRPEPGCLNGPAWSSTRWAMVAHGEGLRVNPLRLGSALRPSGSPEDAAAGPGVQVTIVGDRVVGDVHPDLAAGAVRLARSAGTPLLELTFDGGDAGSRFVGASPCPALIEPVAEALADQLGWTTC
jgi:hypothetical protein